MEIAWFGASCFRIQHHGAVIFLDPYRLPWRYRNLKQRAHGITLSRPPTGEELELRSIEDLDPLAKAGTEPYRIDRPGEYEIAGMFIDAYAASPHPGTGPGGLVLRLVGGHTKIAHLGQLTAPPPDAVVTHLRHANALVVPPGGRGQLAVGELVKLVSRIDPYWVVPMGYSDADEVENAALVEKLVAGLGFKVTDQQPALTVSGHYDGHGTPQIANLRARVALKKSIVA